LVGRHVPSWEYEVRYFLHFLIWGGRPNCELARNNDPLRGVFSRPIATPLTFRQCSLPLASVGREGLEGMMAVDKIGQIRRAFFERHLPIKEMGCFGNTLSHFYRQPLTGRPPRHDP